MRGYRAEKMLWLAVPHCSDLKWLPVISPTAEGLSRSRRFHDDETFFIATTDFCEHTKNLAVGCGSGRLEILESSKSLHRRIWKLFVKREKFRDLLEIKLWGGKTEQTKTRLQRHNIIYRHEDCKKSVHLRTPLKCRPSK